MSRFCFDLNKVLGFETFLVMICRFAAGDVVLIRPCNAEDDVQRLCELLRLDPDSRFILRTTENSSGMSVSCIPLGCL